MKKKLLKITATLTALITFMLCLSIYVSAASDQLIRVKLSVNSSSVSIKVGGDYHIDGGRRPAYRKLHRFLSLAQKSI